MKFIIKKEKFQKELQKVCGIIGSRTTLPVLGNVVVEAKEGQLFLTSTDLNLRIESVINEVEIKEDGVTSIPAKKILSLVSYFPADSDVSIDTDENFHSKIKCGSMAVTLLGLDPNANGFPVKTDFEKECTITLKSADFIRLFDRVSYAVSVEDSRKTLEGSLLSIKGNTVTAAATDGRRLAVMEIPVEGENAVEKDMILTLQSINEVKHCLNPEGSVTLNIGQSSIFFEIDNTVITAKLIEGNYPPYRQVIPKEFKKKIELPADAFVSAIEMLNASVTSESIQVQFSNNQLKFYAASNYGDGSQVIEVPYEGEEMSLSFNPRFLLDPFKHIPQDKVLLSMNDSLHAISITTDDGFIYIIMPMRPNTNV